MMQVAFTDKELWLIPIDDQSALHLDESAVIHKRN